MRCFVNCSGEQKEDFAPILKYIRNSKIGDFEIAISWARNNIFERTKKQLDPCFLDFHISISHYDTLKYRCTVIPRVDAFKQSFFVRTYSNWNNLPLSIREIVNSGSLSSSLKMHLWLLLGLKPD